MNQCSHLRDVAGERRMLSFHGYSLATKMAGNWPFYLQSNFQQHGQHLWAFGYLNRPDFRKLSIDQYLHMYIGGWLGPLPAVECCYQSRLGWGMYGAQESCVFQGHRYLLPLPPTYTHSIIAHIASVYLPFLSF